MEYTFLCHKPIVKFSYDCIRRWHSCELSPVARNHSPSCHFSASTYFIYLNHTVWSVNTLNKFSETKLTRQFIDMTVLFFFKLKNGKWNEKQKFVKKMNEKMYNSYQGNLSIHMHWPVNFLIVNILFFINQLKYFYTQFLDDFIWTAILTKVHLKEETFIYPSHSIGYPIKPLLIQFIALGDRRMY